MKTTIYLSNCCHYENLLNEIYKKLANTYTEKEYDCALGELCKQHKMELTNESVLNFFLQADFENETLVKDIRQWYVDNQ